jgi:hypothetical protein
MTPAIDLTTLTTPELQQLVEQAQALIAQRAEQAGRKTRRFSEIRITHRNGSVDVDSPYHPDFVKAARRLNGKFGGGVWTFDGRDTERICEALIEVYGTDGSMPVEVVDIEVVITGNNGGDTSLFALGRQIAQRRGRDTRVQLGDGVVIVEGGFPASAGSAKYPRLVSNGPVKVLVRDVPRILAEKAASEDPDTYRIAE